MDYLTTIGLEIHVELLTNSKMFCGCPADFGGDPNTKTCPVCLGHPGSLPVMNRKAVESTIRLGLSLNCDISPRSIFHRKNYFYPDMPKNYQISQYDIPLCVGGCLDVEMEGYARKVGITRVHLEEDTGKSLHVGESGRIHGADFSLENFNRAGVPLAEIVTEPDIKSPEEARAFAQLLRSTIRYIGISDGKMEEGSLRVDANISISAGEELGTKVEIKNMNSFKALQRALAYEEERQRKVLNEGGTIVQETRHWDDAAGITHPLRSKEEAFDYRYFPEPDLLPVEPEPAWIDELRESLPELPVARAGRLKSEYGLPVEMVSAIIAEKALADFYEEALKSGGDPREIAKWIAGDLAALLNEQSVDISGSPVTPAYIGELVGLITKKTISGKMAKDLLKETFSSGKSPAKIVKEKGLLQIADEDELMSMVEKVIAENPEAVEDFKNGKEQSLKFMMGQVMKMSRGKANPQITSDLIKQKLS
ncbi:MAG: Asp-tRNA(Asn)/Glu-tRNA(Gln) amidotransferase subunit GatB [Actinobacteria bacterium]|nr:Asp-tRNA(Asn)/Glu-tRNA(Gln) amidotransferase subunit GatB [Actinomycetota bacterium]